MDIAAICGSLNISPTKIGRITPAGVITEFSIPTANARSFGIAAGSDGNLWFTESYVVQLRADRLGSGNNRIYTLNATATDLAGNTAMATATCAVPHDQEKK